MSAEQAAGSFHPRPSKLFGRFAFRWSSQFPHLIAPLTVYRLYIQKQRYFGLRLCGLGLVQIRIERPSSVI